LTLPEPVFQVVHWSFSEDDGAMLVQIAHDGHPDRLLMIVRATREKSRQLGGVSVSSCFLADLSGI
jgi:hypothetical protein